MAGFWSKLFSNDEKPSSAQTAKDRLKVIVASEQGLGRRLSQDKIDQMKKEKQIKKWSKIKKEALINGEFESLINLAKKRFHK